jgi:methylated-DNA-[protein]-cysteine S-methyltransferase
MGEYVAIGEVESPVGRLRLATTQLGVVRLSLPRESGKGFAGWLQRKLPDAEQVDWLPHLDHARRELEEYFAGRRTRFEVPLDLRGTPFQLACWRALLEIPLGETRSYAELARAIGRPTAVRAVGAANGANPVAVIVPCHRVINTGGGLGGYGGGLPTKRRLLAFERSIEPLGRLL